MTFYCGTCNEEHWPCEVTNSETIESLCQQLAVRDLEVMQLREGLSDIRNIAQKCKQESRDIDTIYMKSNSLLSTTFTPDYLREWLGEPVGYWRKGDTLDESDYYPVEYCGHFYSDEYTPLYSPKLEIK